MVFQKQGQWIELTALLLEGAPTVSMRSVRTDGSTAKVRVLEVQATVATAAVPESAAPAGNVLAKPEPKPASEVIATATTSGEPASKPRIVKRTDAIAPTGFNPDAALGPVSVEVMVDEKGAIARILSTKGNPALLSPALQAIRNWSFEPAIAAGQPAPGVLLLEVAFQARR